MQKNKTGAPLDPLSEKLFFPIKAVFTKTAFHYKTVGNEP